MHNVLMSAVDTFFIFCSVYLPLIFVGISFLYIYKKNGLAEVFFGIFVIFAAYILGFMLKLIFGVNRPFVISGTQPLFLPLDLYSFPSLHATVLSSFVVLFAYFFRKSLWVSIPVVALVLTARVVSGVHTVVDMIFGVLFGLLVAAIILLLRRIAKPYLH